MSIWASLHTKFYTLMGLICFLIISPISLANSLSEKEALLLVKYFDGICVKNGGKVDRIPTLIEDLGGEKVPDDVAAKIDPDILKMNAKSYYLEIDQLPPLIIGFNSTACSVVYSNITPGDVNLAINKLYKVSDQRIEKDGAQNLATFIVDESPSVGSGFIFNKYDVIEDEDMYGVLSFALESELNKALVDSSNNKCGLPNSLIEQTKMSICMIAAQSTPNDETQCIKNGLTENTKTQKAQLLYLRTCGYPDLADEYKILIHQNISHIQFILYCSGIKIDYLQLWNNYFLDVKGSPPCNELDNKVMMKRISEEMASTKKNNSAFKLLFEKFKMQ